MKVWNDDLQHALFSIGTTHGGAAELQGLINRGFTLDRLATVYGYTRKQLMRELVRYNITYGKCKHCNDPKPARNNRFCSKKCLYNALRTVTRVGWYTQAHAPLAA